MTNQKIIQSLQDLLIAYVTIAIVSVILGIVTFSIVAGKHTLTEFEYGLLLGTIANVGFVAIVRFLFGKTVTTIERKTEGKEL